MNITGLTAVTQTFEGNQIAGYNINSCDDVSLDATTFVESLVNIFNIVTTGNVTIKYDGKPFRIGDIKAEGTVTISGNNLTDSKIFGNIYARQGVMANHIRQVKNKLIGSPAEIRLENARVASVAAGKILVLENVEQYGNSRIQVLDGDLLATGCQLGNDAKVKGDIQLENVRLAGSAVCLGSFTARNSKLGNVITATGPVMLTSVEQDPQGAIKSETASILVQAGSKVGQLCAGGNIEVDQSSRAASQHNNFNETTVTPPKRNIFQRLFSFFSGR